MATTFNLSASFNGLKASQGGLCVVTTGDISGSISSSSSSFVGSGVCKANSNDNFSIIINSVEYVFGRAGSGINAAASGKYIKNATVTGSVAGADAGSAVGSDTKNTVAKSRGAGGEIIYTPSSEAASNYNVLIESLNARDQFAVQALRGILSNIKEDPATLSDDVMNYYCDTAYKWAANMMVAAAKVRSVLEDTYSPEEDEEEIGILDTNTDRLLNNLIVELAKSDVTVDQVTSKRVSIPDLITFLNNYVKDGNSTVGLKDLITAINNISSGSQPSSVTINSMPSLSGSINIGDSGLGRDASHPLFIKIVADE